MDGLHQSSSIAPDALGVAGSQASSPPPRQGTAVQIERDPVTGDVLAARGDIEALLGITAAELTTPGALLELVHQADRSRVAPAAGDSDTLNYRVRTQDGNHIWLAEKLRDMSVDFPGAVVSELRNVDAKITATRLAEALDRFTDAVVIFELAETPGTLTVVACNDAGADLVAPAGEQVTVGQIPELDGEDGDFVDLLSGVIKDQEPFAFIVSGGNDVAASTLTAECLDPHTGLVLLRQYSAPTTDSGFDGIVDATPTQPEPQEATGFFANVLREANSATGEPLALLMRHLDLTAVSEWQLSADTGTATLVSATTDIDLPEVIDLSAAAIHRLQHLETSTTSPDPAVRAIHRRLAENLEAGTLTDIADGVVVARVHAKDHHDSDRIVVGLRNHRWSAAEIDEFDFATALLAQSVTAPVDPAADDASVPAGSHSTAEAAELLERERFIGLVTRTLLAATSETLPTQMQSLTNLLNDTFDVHEIELWQFENTDGATHCEHRWSERATDSPLWTHVAPQQDANDYGAVRFISSTATWTTEDLRALDAVGEIVWLVTQNIETSQQFSTAFTHAPVAVVLCTTDGTVTDCNDLYAEFIGEQPRTLWGTSLNRFATIDGRSQLEQLIAAAADPETTSADRTADVPFRRTDDEVVWGRVHVAHATPDSGETHLVVHIEDVSDAMMRQRSLEYQVSHDDLTLLATRQRLTQALGDACADTDTTASLLLIDLDHFENIRDRYGRDQADQVLRVVADRLRTLVRPQDLVARTGPAEFAILLQGDESDASALATRLLSNIADPVLVRHTEIQTTANIGIAAITDSDQTTSVLRKADNALDAAKGAGRLSSATFDTALHEQLLRDERLEADLGDAISAGDITMHYQPEVTLRTGELQGFEALARWDHPEFGLLDSSEFVSHADRIGVIRDIDDLAVDAAAEQLGLWQRQFPDRVGSIRVNVSGTSIRSQSFIDRLKTVLTSHEIDAAKFWIEVSEDELLGDGEPPLDQLTAIKDIGCKILIDDFGHGLSSFSMLRRMPVDALKIEPSLIRSLGQDPDAATIVSATIQLSRTLGLEVVAEGIETMAQATELIELGCQWGHGHLYSHAVSPTELSPIIVEGRVEALDRHEG